MATYGRRVSKLIAHSDYEVNGFEPDKSLPGPPEKTYFVLCPNISLVKIGKTTDLTARLQSLRTMNASPIELLAIVPDCEAELHNRFDEHRRHGEWFRACSAMVEYLKDLKNEMAAVRLQEFVE